LEHEIEIRNKDKEIYEKKMATGFFASFPPLYFQMQRGA
jgi:hypothetical protein